MPQEQQQRPHYLFPNEEDHMANLNGSLLAICALLASVGVGWLAVHLARTGFDYSGARGNPRQRAQAHESLWDIGKGAALIFGAAALAGLAAATIHV